MYTLDTNAIIYYFKGDHEAIPVIERAFADKKPVYLSAVSEIELFGFSNLTAQEIKQFEQFLSTVSIIPLDSKIARVAGALRRIYHLKTPDSAIAATCLFTGSTLLTRNVRDFQHVPNLVVEKI